MIPYSCINYNTNIRHNFSQCDSDIKWHFLYILMQKLNFLNCRPTLFYSNSCVISSVYAIMENLMQNLITKSISFQSYKYLFVSYPETNNKVNLSISNLRNLLIYILKNLSNDILRC